MNSPLTFIGARTSALIAATLFGASFASATTYTFTYTDSLQSAFGTLSTDAQDFATAGVLDVVSGPDAGVYNLFANPSEPGTATSPLGAFIYDDRVYPAATPHLDTYGLLFTGGGLEINIWGNSGPHDYSNWSSFGNGYNVSQNDGTFTLQTTPEPFSAATLAIGGVALLHRRRRARA